MSPDKDEKIERLYASNYSHTHATDPCGASKDTGFIIMLGYVSQKHTDHNALTHSLSYFQFQFNTSSYHYPLPLSFAPHVEIRA